MDFEFFIAPPAQREDELREENVLATWPRSHGWMTTPSFQSGDVAQTKVRPVAKERTRAAEPKGGETR